MKVFDQVPMWLGRLTVLLVGAGLPGFGWAGAETAEPSDPAAALSWPGFRGPHGSGVARQGGLPVHFGPHSNVVWKIRPPGGHSSPCVAGDRIFLTGYDDENLVTLCLDRRSGAEHWRRTLRPGTIERGARWSHPATSTPVTDGGQVFVYFAAYGLACYSLDGEPRWQRPLPTPVTQHGASTSPVLAGNRLVLVCDQDVDSYLLAVDPQSGIPLWKTARPGFRRGFSTPLPWPPQQPESVVVAGTLRLVAYRLEDGSEWWSVPGLPNEMVASPVAGNDMVFAAGWTYGAGVRSLPDFDSLLERGDQDRDGLLTREEAPSGPAKQHFVYIDADKNGRMTREEWDTLSEIFTLSENALLAVRAEGARAEVVWKQNRGLPYVPSPLFYEGRIYLVKNGGLASCFEAATGREHYREERLGALGDYYASPVAAGGLIAAASEQGVVVIYRAGPDLEVVARNDLEEPILATPALVNGTMYVRTREHFYAFREPGP